ncbi:protocadherin Fat 4-like [Gigantopelta aegis]|uniref:protocadherin Fat 4-like n=1 Tax=Gigantopelta aegis TaxID=1735272 RepID=UPI001B889090|nr:protocadherin Fat 4-like [Gigantopelta aegis]
MFNMEDETGVLTLKRSLSSGEVGTSVNLTVVVCDDKPSNTPRCDSASVIITVISISIQAKTLNNSFAVNVTENVRVGTYVLNISVANYTGYVSHDMVSFGLFSLNKSTGVITTQKELDWETIPKSHRRRQYSILAYNEGEEQCFFDNFGSVLITVEDVNDNIPMFTQSLYSGRVDENSNISTEVFFDLTILVTDPDSGVYGRSTFSLSGIGSDKFSVTTTEDKVAVVAVAGLLDKETVASYNLVLSAVDGVAHDGIQFTATTTLSIAIHDVNDNAPVFESLSDVTIKEEKEAMYVMTVHARDQDAGSNGRVTYTMSGGRGYFRIDENNGTITTTQTIDREKIPVFVLNVIASDSGTSSQSTATSVTIHIEDINDNDPVLLGLHDANIDENTNCSMPIVTVSASDPDQNQSVSLSTTNSNFQIDTSGHLRCISSLDYENKTSHSVTIIATDSGQSPRSINKTMTVSVKDLNDNAPQFSAIEYTTNISTVELRRGKPVIVVNANDMDSGEGGKIRFYLSDTLFYVETVGNVGVVRVKSDTGQIGIYSINITAEDNGTHPLRNVTTITITVARANDVVKFVTNDFSFTVTEGKRNTNKAIGSVNSTYDSSQISVQYALPGSSLFSINNTTGDIFCNTLLDRETISQHLIVVRVYSTSNITDGDVALITIDVDDINDNDPKFDVTDRVREIEIPENRRNMKVVDMNANDEDEGENGKITYKITESHLPFQIDQATGEITLNRELDYEITQTYNITVEALDGGNPPRSASVFVIVHVTDENDHPPEFKQNTYTVSVNESAKIGESVFLLTATDGDSVANADLDYVIAHISPNHSCSFNISNEEYDSNSGKNVTVGKLTVAGQLDRESTEVCTIEIIVYDSQNLAVRLNTTATMTISVLDVNDNPPMFEGGPYNVTISRDVPLGHVIFNESTINATDRDAGDNRDVKLSLSGKGSKYFQIIASSGKVTVIKALYDAPDFIYLILTATDGGDVPQSSHTKVAIKISDDNTRPWFPESYMFTVIEEANPVTFPNWVQAKDRNHSEEVICDCQYQLSSLPEHQGLFTINSSTGELTQTAVIDREVVGDFLIVNVTATDKGQPQKSTKTTVVIKIEDIDDHAPHFNTSQKTQHFSVSQYARVGSSVDTIAYTDEDGRDYSNVTMGLLPGNPQNGKNLFRVQDNHIYVASSLTRNTTEDYVVHFSVIVRSVSNTPVSGGSNLTVVAAITITITLGTNNTAPSFTQDMYSYDLLYLTKKYQLLDLGIHASDNESDVVKYLITDEKAKDVFQMDSATGKIRLKVDVDDTIPTVITFAISAVDVNEHPRASSAKVVIKVTGRAAYTRNLQQSKKIFTILFSVMTALLTIFIILTVFACYKWRVALSPATDRNVSSGSPLRYEPAIFPEEELTSRGGYLRPEGAGYTPLEREDFTGSDGRQNPAYIPDSSYIRPNEPKFYKPTVDFPY